MGFFTKEMYDELKSKGYINDDELSKSLASEMLKHDILDFIDMTKGLNS